MHFSMVRRVFLLFLLSLLGRPSNHLAVALLSCFPNKPTHNHVTVTVVRRSRFANGPDPSTKPNYEEITGPLGKTMDDLFLRVFRSKLSEQVGTDSTKPSSDYAAIAELAATMNQKYQPAEIQKRAQKVLIALFPSWMPPWYAVLFSRPFPAFSARMNAWATRVAGTWLMGECEINDVPIEFDSNDQVTKVGRQQGLLVKRCRFLEEAGCASVCVNSCKIPTQTFFLDKMGLPLTMEPNYETFECQFSFGRMPNVTTEMAALRTPCLAVCSTAGALRVKQIGSPLDDDELCMEEDQILRPSR